MMWKHGRKRHSPVAGIGARACTRIATRHGTGRKLMYENKMVNVFMHVLNHLRVATRLEQSQQSHRVRVVAARRDRAVDGRRDTPW